MRQTPQTYLARLTGPATAYREVAPTRPGFADRRELWRLAGYLAVVAVDGHRPFGRRCLDRLAAAVRVYR